MKKTVFIPIAAAAAILIIGWGIFYLYGKKNEVRSNTIRINFSTG